MAFSTQHSYSSSLSSLFEYLHVCTCTVSVCVSVVM